MLPHVAQMDGRMRLRKQSVQVLGRQRSSRRADEAATRLVEMVASQAPSSSSSSSLRRPATAGGYQTESRRKLVISDVLDKVHRHVDPANNVRIEIGEDGMAAQSPMKSQPAEMEKRDRSFLWHVFDAFDRDHSGYIDIAEVRSLFDRVALEQSMAAKGHRSTVNKNEAKEIRAASAFLTRMFDDDGDGKLGRTEIDRFFAIFTDSSGGGMIAWSAFCAHGLSLIHARRESEAETDDAKPVMSREDLKLASEEIGTALRSRTTKSASQHSRSVPVLARSTSGAMVRTPPGTSVGSYRKLAQHGQRSRGAMPSMV
jgi:hypothetical protein